MKHFPLLLAFSLVLLSSLNAQQPKRLPFKVKEPHEDTHEMRLPQAPRLFIPPPFTSPTGFTAIKVNQLVTNEPQNEPSIAINPKDKNNMVAAYRDFYLGSNPAIRNVGIATTTDGGATWFETHAQYGDHDRFSDPGVAVDTAGNFYVVTLDYNYHRLSETFSEGGSITVRESSDGGLTWIPFLVATNPQGGSIYDKEMIWVDKSPTSPYEGAIYIAWSGYGGLNFASSPGLFMPFTVTAPGDFGYPTPTTGPNGEVYVFGAAGDSISEIIQMFRSTDGGVTFPDSVAASDTNRPGSAIVSEIVSATDIPAAAVDNSFSPYRGTVYATWISDVHGDLDVYCSRSTNRGVSWEPSVRVNNDPIGNGHNQFFPGIAVDDSGYVSLIFLDSRNDSANILVDSYLAQSRDGGKTFKNFRISSQNFDPRIDNNGDVRFGDYMGIASSQGRVVPIWTDSHLGNQDVFITLIDSLAFGNSVIKGTVFNDCNGDGLRNYGDPPMANRLMYLSGDASGTTSTDSSGRFEFRFLTPGNYTVAPDTNGGWVQTSPPSRPVPLVLADHDTSAVTFGVHKIPPPGYLDGWNLVSIPRLIPDPRASVLFPEAQSSVWGYSGSYERFDSLQPGLGYWIRLGCIPTVDFTGDSITTLDLPAQAGWNLIGTLGVPILASAVTSTPPGILSSPFYEYGGGYSPATTLTPGKGFWIRASATGVLHFSIANAATVRAEAPMELSRYDWMSIRDAGGREQRLYFTSDASARRAATYFELPPLPPQGGFDIRFSSQRLLELVGSESTSDIKLEGARFPLRITWDVNDGEYLLAGSATRISLRGMGTARVVEPTATSFTLRREQQDRTVPTMFSLSQNHPNPFNPATDIHYAIPIASRVSLNVFDVLGRQVMTIVNEPQEAGGYSVHFEASTLPSGVYFYRLSAGAFTDVKKMLLLR